MKKSKLMRGASAVLATIVATTSMSLSAFAAVPKINFTDNGNGTTTVTGTDVDKIAVAQYDELGALKAFGISSLMGDKQTVNMSYDKNLDTYVYSFSDWSTLKSDYAGTKVGQRTISLVDFDSEKQGAYAAYNGGSYEEIETTGKDGKTTKALHIKNDNLNAQFAGLATNTSDVVVYECDFKTLDVNSNFKIDMKTVIKNTTSSFYDGWQRMLTVTPKDATSVNVKLGKDDKVYATTANPNEWHTVALVIDYSIKNCEYYYDGTHVGSQSYYAGYDPNVCTPDVLQIQNAGTTGDGYVIDNVRVYEGTHPRTTIDAYDVYFDVEKDNIEPINYSATKTALNGKYAFHLRSGNTYDGNGNSATLENKPYENNGEIYVPVAELCDAWGVNTPAGVTTDADGYGKATDLARALGLNVYTADSEINSGLVVMATSFTAPTGAELQKMNDYVFYMRPTKEQITEIYRSSETKGEHPRIMATQDDFDRVRALVESGENEYINAWAEQLIEYADDRIKGFDDPTWQEYPKYETYDGLRMEFQRQLQNLVSLWGMAYHITGEDKYADYGYEALKMVCEFPDWNPNHSLDTCEAMTAVSIGYDWLYNTFTEEERQVIEEGMYKHGILQSYPAFLSNGSALGGAYTSNNNHGVIDNGAAIVTSLAFMDVYPKECSWMMSAALECIENSVYQWSTGMWYEGPNYWELTMMHTVKFISAMQTALGTDLGFGSLQGLDISAKPQISVHGYWNTYNYGDTVELRYIVPELIWLANQYDDPAVAEYVAEQSKDGFKLYPDQEWWKNTWIKGEDTALALLWYDPEKQEGVETLEMDTVYYDEELDVLTMRNTWDTEGQVFVGLKGRGGVDGHSNLDTGSFVFESDGIRWVRDVGTGSYNDSTGYFDWNSQTARRWKEFPTRAESHSTVVVNPEAEKADHKVALNASDAADLEWDGEIASIDMSKVLFDVKAATRKFKMVDNNQSLVIQDNITLDGTDNTVYWFLMTADRMYTTEGNNVIMLPCEVTEVENGFILTQKDENGVEHSVRIDYVIESDGTLSTTPKAGDYTKNVRALFEDSEEESKALYMLNSSEDLTKPDGRRYQSKRLELKLTGVSGNVKITAKITPMSATGTMTSVTDYVNGL